MYGPCTCITSACATQSKKPTTLGRPEVTPNSLWLGWMHVAAAIATPRSKVPTAFVCVPGMSRPFCCTEPKYSLETVRQSSFIASKSSLLAPVAEK